MRRTALALATALTALALLAAGCEGDSGDSGDDGTTPTSATAGAPTDDLSSYDSVADMAKDLDAAGLTCTLEYEGLKDDEREVSLCAVNGEYTELSVWTDASRASGAAKAAAGDDDPFVEGANWTIDVDTAATADAVAAALGGRTATAG